MKFVVTAALIVSCHLFLQAKDDKKSSPPCNVERMTAYAVQQEVHASRLEKRNDLCLGFGNGLIVDQGLVTEDLKRAGVKMHANEWCNEGPRGFRIDIVAPITESGSGTCEFMIETGDLRAIKAKGEHFGTLLRQGTYVIKCLNSAPELIEYRKKCCANSP